MLDTLRTALAAHPDNPFLQGHVTALESLPPIHRMITMPIPIPISTPAPPATAPAPHGIVSWNASIAEEPATNDKSSRADGGNAGAQNNQ